MNRFLLAFLFASSVGFSQNPGVPVYKEGQGAKPEAGLRKALLEMRNNKALPMGMEQVAAQLSRTSCQLKLAEPSRKPLSSRERWTVARSNHLRVGWYYKAPKMAQWQINLSGGFAITEDGAVATCFHVVVPMHHEMREGFLFAADDDDHIFPVTEILAASIRSANHVKDAALAGADVATIPPAVLKGLVKHPLTDKGIESFLADWKKTGQKI